jgi:hypothetical protein
MDQTTILIVGIFIFILLAIGAALTTEEFRKMDENPEKYKNPDDKDGDEK